jgi:hypothetical protein
MDPRASPEDVEKRTFVTLAGIKLRPLVRAARRQSLYRLGYLSSSVQFRTNTKWNLPM